MTYYGEGTHPKCGPSTGHVCQRPSGRECVTDGCTEPAGTAWGPHWCPDHDAERIDRISRQLDEIMAGVRRDR